MSLLSMYRFAIAKRQKEIKMEASCTPPAAAVAAAAEATEGNCQTESEVEQRLMQTEELEQFGRPGFSLLSWDTLTKFYSCHQTQKFYYHSCQNLQIRRTERFH